MIADPALVTWKPKDGKEPRRYNTSCRPDEERLHGTLRLMTLAILRLPDLAMIAQLMHMDHQDRVVLRAACDIAGGALRLAHRALQTHGRDVDYDIRAWIDSTPLTAAVELACEHDEVPVVIGRFGWQPWP